MQTVDRQGETVDFGGSQRRRRMPSTAGAWQPPTVIWADLLGICTDKKTKRSVWVFTRRISEKTGAVAHARRALSRSQSLQPGKD